MGILVDGLSARVQGLLEQRKRIVSNHAIELAEIDSQLRTLQGAAKTISPEVEQAYDALIAMGLINPVQK